MGIKFFNNVKTTVKEVFSSTRVEENSPLLMPTPFSTLYLPEKKIAFHIVSLNVPLLSATESTFFYDWATHAEQQGIQPIHIWEDRWLMQKDIIVSQLASQAKNTSTIFARNTLVQRVTQPVADDFLNEHHLGGSPRARTKYGLFHKKTNLLLGVATFSAPRKFYRDGKEFRSYELIRYGSAKGTTITGGLSKLLKTFIKEVKPDDIMTYADRDWWSGKSYVPLGFKMIEHTPPLQFWIHPEEKIRYTGNQLARLLERGKKGGIKTSVNNLAQEKGYIKIFNSGNRKFLLALK